MADRAGGLLICAFMPVLWFFLMHDYQRQRVLMLLDPEKDPLGAATTSSSPR